MGLAGERVGFERNYLSKQDWELVQERLPRLSMVDCTAMMEEVRWIKTPGEVALLRNAADLLDDAYLAAFPRLRAGMTERDVHAEIIHQCLKRGAGWAHGLLNSSRNTVSFSGERDTVFHAGDFIRNDYIAYLQGYPGHQSG